MITSPKNPRVAGAARLKKRALRDDERRFLVEGAQVVREALDAEVVETIFASGPDPLVDRARADGVPVEQVSEKVMAHLTSTVTPQGIAAVARYVDVSLAGLRADPMLVPVLCAVRDPGNAGTILRSADAAGADAVIFADSSVDVYNAKTVRASAGSLFHLPVVRGAPREEAVETLRGRGMQVLAAAADGEASIYETDFSRPTAILFGNEAWGLDPEVRALADRSVRVPIEGDAESLNLAAAAAIVLFESVRARGGAGEGGRLASIAALIGAGAHDIRSPLTALAGFVSTLRANWERIEDEQKRTIVGGMAVDAQRISALTRLIVDTARVDAGVALRSLGERADVAEAARWVADLFAVSDEFPPVEIAGGASVAVDPERVKAILLSLAEGAIWWGSEGPIRIEAGESGAVTITRAGGSGSDQDILAGPESGGKVGLYASRRIAEALGGALEADASDGVVFRLRLPT